MCPNGDWTYNDSADYSYDENSAEVAGGYARLKVLTPVAGTFHASYNTDGVFDGVWGNGSLVGTPFSGASVSGGRLILTAGGFVRYDAIGKLGTTGTFYCLCYPNYSGFPPANRVLFSYGTGPVLTSSIILQHLPTGQIRILFYDSNGVMQEFLVGGWVPVAGEEVIVELGFDLEVGIIYLFFNGLLLGGSPVDLSGPKTFVQPLYFRLGTGPAEGGASDYKVTEFTVYSTVQHTENHTPPGQIPDATYAKSPKRVLAINRTKLQSITSSTLSYSADAGTAVRFAVNDGAQDLSWDGAAWGICADFSGANIAAVFASALPYLPPGEYSPVVWLESSTGSETPEVDNVVFEIELPSAGLEALNPICAAAAFEAVKNKIGVVQLIAGPLPIQSVTEDGIYKSINVTGDLTAVLPGDLVVVSGGTAAGAWYVRARSSILVIASVERQTVPSGSATVYRMDNGAWSANLDEALARIREITGYRFDGVQTFTEYRSGSNNKILYLTHKRILSIKTIAVDNNSSIRLSSVVLEEGRLALSAGLWPRGRRNIKVTYAAGFDELPDDLIRAAAYLAATEMISDSSAGDGNGDSVLSQSADGYSESRGPGGLWGSRRRELAAKANLILDRYVPVAGGH